MQKTSILAGRYSHCSLAIVLFMMVPAVLAAQAPTQPDAAQPTGEPAARRKWSDTFSFSVLSANGNRRGYGFGLANGYHYRWPKYTFGFNLNASRLANSSVDHYAVVSAAGYDIYESRPPGGGSRAESSYHLDAELGRRATQQFTELIELGWSRNRFAGVNNRYTFFLVGSRQWGHLKRASFRTEFGAGYIRKDLIYNNLHRDARGFPAVRLGYSYKGKIGSRAAFSQEFKATDNLNFPSSYSLSLHSALTLDISKRIALKAGFDVFYSSYPPYRAINLYDQNGAVIGAVPYKLQQTSSTVSARLLIRF